MSPDELKLGLGLPALVCGIILIAVLRPWRQGSASRWAVANALAAGFAAAYLVLRGWEVNLPPPDNWVWLVYLGLAAAIAAGYGIDIGGGGSPTWTAWVLFAGLSAYLLVDIGFDQSWAWRGMTAGMMVASMAALDRLSGRTGSGLFAFLLCLVVAAAGVVLNESRNETLAQMAWALSVCLGLVAILGWWRPSVKLEGGGMLVCSILLPGLVMSGYFSGGRMPVWFYLLAALAPAAYWLTELPAARQIVARRPMAIQISAILVTAGAAATGALIVSRF